MTDAVVFVRIEPDFVLRDERMLALSWEAKGLYLILWAMPMDKMPRTEYLSWSSKEQMIAVLAAMEGKPDPQKVERALLEIEAQGLIRIIVKSKNSDDELAGISEIDMQGVKRISGNSLQIIGFRAKHSGLNWRSNRGRKPKALDGNYAQVAQQQDLTRPENFPSIPREYPENNPRITEVFPENIPSISRQNAPIMQDQIREEKRREEKIRTENTPPIPPQVIHEPVNPPSDARQDSSFPNPCSMRTAPLEEKTSKPDRPPTAKSFVVLKPLIDGKRPLTEEMKTIVSELHAHLVGAQSSNGVGDESFRQALNLLVYKIGFNATKGGLLAGKDPERVCQALLSALTEAENPAGLFAQHLKRNNDLRDSPIYEQTKAVVRRSNQVEA